MPLKTVSYKKYTQLMNSKLPKLPNQSKSQILFL